MGGKGGRDGGEEREGGKEIEIHCKSSIMPSVGIMYMHSNKLDVCSEWDGKPTHTQHQDQNRSSSEWPHSSPSSRAVQTKPGAV